MTIGTWLTVAQQQLETAGIATARLDTLVLLEDCLGRDRALLLAHPEAELTAEQERVLQQQLVRRETHEPLAYIRGKSEFYGRQFYVDNRVLEPRPESETIIDILKPLITPDADGAIIDVGTGSGALAVTAALELPEDSALHVMAVDIDPGCLEVAMRNAQTLGADVALLQSDLLTQIPADEHIFALLCNLPYVPDNFQINTAAGHEPRLALFGGPDGLDYYRTLCAQAQARGTKKPRYILTEALPPQHEVLAAIAHDYGYRLTQADGFIQLFES